MIGGGALAGDAGSMQNERFALRSSATSPFRGSLPLCSPASPPSLLALGCTKGAPPRDGPPFPVPDFLSPQARAVLSQPIDLSRTDVSLPKTTEEWRARRENAEKIFMRPLLERALEATRVRVEKQSLAGVTIRILTPPPPREPIPETVLINLHGGGYTIGGGDVSAMEGLGLAAAGYRVVSVDYRMPPEHPFPAAVEDGVAVYRALLQDYAPEHIAIFGSSAGGGLTAAVIVAARDAGLPLPAAAVMHTPWSDLSKTGDTYYTLEGIDPVLLSYDGSLAQSAALYAGDAGLDHPWSRRSTRTSSRDSLRPALERDPRPSAQLHRSPPSRTQGSRRSRRPPRLRRDVARSRTDARHA